jgi:putative inorganic carbon (hco3(-)) transporter
MRDASHGFGTVFRRGDTLLFGVSLAVVAITPLVYMSPGVVGLDAARLPKELCVGAGALLGGFSLIGRKRIATQTSVEALLFAFLALSVTSAALQATDQALAARALLLSSSTVLMFMAAGQVGSSHAADTMIVLLAASATAVSIVVLLEAARLVAMSIAGRSPGGPFLHRNHAAHYLTCSIPLFYPAFARARHWALRLGIGIGSMISMCAIVLSRSRASWLGLIIGLSVMSVVLASSVRSTTAAPRRSRPRELRDLIAWEAFLLAGCVVASALALRIWGSADPLRESAAHMLDYAHGSGRGRVLQSAVTLAVVRQHPLLGVAPGHWPIAYAGIAPENDPSLLDGIKRVDDRPLNDWLGVAAERGVPALVVLGGIAVALLASARQLARTDAPGAAALAAIVAIVAILGGLDALLSSAATLQLLAIGVAALTVERRLTAQSPGAMAYKLTAAAITMVVGAELSTTARAAHAAWTYHTDVSMARLQDAIRLDPSDYVALMLLAMRELELDDCEAAVRESRTAGHLRPTFPAPRRLAAACGADVNLQRP